MQQENILEFKTCNYSRYKTLCKTKLGDLYLVSINSNENKYEIKNNNKKEIKDININEIQNENKTENILYLMKCIKVKSEEVKKNIIKEIEKYKELDSKYILPIYNFFFKFNTKEEIICILFDYSDKDKSLYDLIYGNSYFLTSQTIWKIFLQLLIGINYIHKKNKLIEYLTPENIIIDKNKNIKISGINIYLDLSSADTDCSLYKNPETFNGEKLDSKSNMWSLGCILYEMVLKKKFFEDLIDIILLNYQIPETVDLNITNIIGKLICKHDNILEAEKMINYPIIKNKIIEENLFSEIIHESKQKYIF